MHDLRNYDRRGRRGGVAEFLSCIEESLLKVHVEVCFVLGTSDQIDLWVDRERKPSNPAFSPKPEEDTSHCL